MNATEQEIEGIGKLLARAAGEVEIAQSFRYRFSNAGDPCLRAHVYAAWDADDGKAPAQSDRKLEWQLAAACGNAVGAHLEAAARQLGMETQVPRKFDTRAVQVTGSSDIEGKSTVIDIKLVGEKKWDRVKGKAPDPKHRMQINGYAVAADKPRWLLLYVRATSIFDGEPLQWVAHAGDADVELAKDLCSVWEQVDQHRKLRTLPERVFGAAPDKFPCGWCAHQSRCLTQSPEEGAP